MDPTPSDNRPPPPPPRKSGGGRAPTTIQSLDQDILCFIFSLLGLFGVVRCRVVCKSWNAIIAGSNLLEELCSKGRKRYRGNRKTIGWPVRSLKRCLERLAMEEHGSTLAEGSVEIHQWRIPTNGVDQCRTKMGLLLTGVGDRVLRLWSLTDYKCVREYSIPALPLLDFDFDESKIVGLVGSHLCIWRHSGQRTIFPSHQNAFVMGSCMRYFDPDAVVGCEDGTARVYDMYSKKCSRIIRMHPEAVTCLSLDDDKLIFSGSTLGRITLSGLSFDQRVVTLKDSDYAGIKALSYNACSYMVFAGSTAGSASCWDLRTMRQLWERRVSSNVIYSLQHLRDDVSVLVVGGIDGVLRVLDQNTGEVLSSFVMDYSALLDSPGRASGGIETMSGKSLSGDVQIDAIPQSQRPPINCLAVGMKKVITTHRNKYIRLWKFNSLV